MAGQNRNAPINTKKCNKQIADLILANCAAGLVILFIVSAVHETEIFLAANRNTRDYQFLKVALLLVTENEKQTGFREDCL